MEDRDNISKGHFNEELRSLSESQFTTSRPKVDLNNLIKKVKDEEKRSKRQNLVLSVAALSVVAVFGLIITL